MRCPRCGAYLTIGGETNGPVGTKTEIEAHAWAMDDVVKCWACGYQYKPTRKPGDRPKLNMGGNPAGRHAQAGLYDFYRGMGDTRQVYRRKVRGRKVA